MKDKFLNEPFRKIPRELIRFMKDPLVRIQWLWYVSVWLVRIIILDDPDIDHPAWLLQTFSQRGHINKQDFGLSDSGWSGDREPSFLFFAPPY